MSGVEDVVGSNRASGPVGSEAAPGSVDVAVDDADIAVDTPLLSVVSGQPTAEELAALTAVVVALQGQDEAEDTPRHGRSWVRRALLRLGPLPGPGSWRRSGR